MGTEIHFTYLGDRERERRELKGWYKGCKIFLVLFEVAKSSYLKGDILGNL